MTDEEYTLVEIGQIVDSIRLYSHESNDSDIYFNVSYQAAVEKIAAYIRKGFDKKKPAAFVRIGGTA